MFHGPLGDFSWNLFIFITYFSIVAPFNSSVFLSSRALVVNATFATGQVSTSQETEEASTPYKTCRECRVNEERPTGKKHTTIKWDSGGQIGNKNKLILRVPSTLASLSLVRRQRWKIILPVKGWDVVSLSSPRFISGFLGQDYHYKSIAAHIPHDAGSSPRRGMRG